jgi:pyrophosphatase PpaX
MYIATMYKYQYVLFDWDGTLARTLDIWLNSLRSSLHKRGHSFTDTEIGANYDQFKTYFESQGHADIDAIIEEALAESNIRIPNVELYPHAIKVLRQLKEHQIKVALVTTSAHKQIDPLLQKYELSDVFDFVVCGDDTKKSKPDPEPINRAIELLHAPKSQTILIGDSSNDILGAANAGIESVLFYPNDHEVFHNLRELHKLNPTYVIHSLQDIFPLITSGK